MSYELRDLVQANLHANACAWRRCRCEVLTHVVMAQVEPERHRAEALSEGLVKLIEDQTATLLRVEALADRWRAAGNPDAKALLAALSPPVDEEFYEDDEPTEKIIKAFEEGTKGRTAPGSCGFNFTIELDQPAKEDR